MPRDGLGFGVGERVRHPEALGALLGAFLLSTLSGTDDYVVYNAELGGFAVTGQTVVGSSGGTATRWRSGSSASPASSITC